MQFLIQTTVAGVGVTGWCGRSQLVWAKLTGVGVLAKLDGTEGVTEVGKSEQGQQFPSHHKTDQPPQDNILIGECDFTWTYRVLEVVLVAWSHLFSLWRHECRTCLHMRPGRLPTNLSQLLFSY